MVITFGSRHRAQDGTALGERYVIVKDRTEAFVLFGAQWAFDYPNETQAGVLRYNLREFKVPLDRWLAHDVDAHINETECSACSRLDSNGKRLPDTGIVAV